MEFGKIVRRHREALRLTQGRLAEASGLEQSAVSRIERGLQAVDVTSVPLFEDALGLPRGGLLLEAGLVEVEGVERAILADPQLDPLSRELLVETYRAFVRRAERSRTS